MAGKFSMNDLLNNQSKNAQGGAAARHDVKEIPIGKIKPSPQNEYDVQDVEGLAASIEAVGLLHAIVVKEPDGEGFYELISGERRFRACKLLYEGGNARYATIPSKVEAPCSAAETKLKLLHANATTRVLTDYEKTMQGARIKEALQELKAEGYVFKGRMREIAAEILKVSPAQMGRMESINKNLLPELMEEFKAGNIGITTAYDLSTLKPDAQAAAGNAPENLPEDDYSGLKVKYRVYKAKDNSPVENCFVLRPDIDKAARAALEAYADTTDNKQLSADIRAWLESMKL